MKSFFLSQYHTQLLPGRAGSTRFILGVSRFSLYFVSVAVSVAKLGFACVSVLFQTYPVSMKQHQHPSIFPCCLLCNASHLLLAGHPTDISVGRGQRNRRWAAGRQFAGPVTERCMHSLLHCRFPRKQLLGGIFLGFSSPMSSELASFCSYGQHILTLAFSIVTSFENSPYFFWQE